MKKSNYKNMIRLFINISVVLVTFLTLYSCNSTEPDDKITLSAVDASCTEVWLQITGEAGKEIQLIRDDKEIERFTLTASPMTIIDDSLQINTSYNYQLIRADNGEKSSTATATTLDTTGNNFTWQTFTFGGHGGSGTLYDVAIIDDDNIWAVGEINIADTSVNGYTMYCYVKWNGIDWEYGRLKFFPPGSSGDSITTKGYSIFTFNENDVWISGGAIFHWDGLHWETFYNTGAEGAKKIWGTNSNDLYFVGNNGNIAHYNGSSWTKIESGTDVDLKDISGTPDLNEIWTCGWEDNNGRVSLLRINENDVESIWDNQNNTTLNTYMGTLNSLYANGNKEFVLAGAQIFRHSLVDKRQVKYEWVKTYNGSIVLELGNYGYRIKGSSKNNIAVAGDAAMIWHFNGAIWYKYSELYNLDDRLYGLAVTDNVIAAVGKRYSPGTLGGALLLIGRR